MYKYITLLLLFFLLISCGSNYKTLKNSEDKIPAWYLEDQKAGSNIFGKALGESENLEIAIRKAQSLAIADAAIKIKNETSALRNIFISQKQNKSEKVNNEIVEKFDETVSIISNKLNMSDFRTIHKEVFKDTNLYRVYIQIGINKNTVVSKISQN